MNRDGYILVAVLTTMLVLAGLLGSATLVAQSALRSARADDGAAVLDGLLRGGLELAGYQVFALRQPFAAVNGRPIQLAGGTAVPTFADEATKIDVNAADLAVLAATFKAAGVDGAETSALIARLTAMRGTAQTGAPAAPDAVSDAMPPAGAAGGTQAPHTDFSSVDDFIAFAGFDREAAASLAGLLTVSNPDGKVDVMTADRRVLLALPEMSEALADTILNDRRGGAPAIAGLKAALGRQANAVKFEPGPCYAVEVTATDALGRIARRHGIVSASKSTGEPFYILAWEQAP